MKQDKLTNLFDFLPKSKVKAGDGLEAGKYPFYTSSENQSKYLDEYQHEPGCLVFGTGGKASAHFTTSRFATSTDCITIRPMPKARIDAGYVFQFFKGNMQVLESGFKGAGLKHISKAYLAKIQIPYPEEIDDQKRIAHLLGKVEGLIAQRKQHLQQLDDLLKSAFLEIFGDPVRNEKGWEKVSLQSGCEEIYRYPTFYGFEYSSEGVPVVRIGNILFNGNIDPKLENYVFITQEISDKYPRTILKFNDILMAVRGDGSTGKRIGIINSSNLVGANMSPNLLRFSCKENVFNTKYFFHFLTSERGQVLIAQNINRAAKKTITAKNLKEISVPCPPIELQKYFDSIVQKIEAIKASYQQSQTDLESLYIALSQKAFKGELELSRVPLPTEGPDIAAEEKTDVEGKQPMEPVFILPAPEELAALQTAEGRKSLLSDWLNAWLEQLGDVPFSSQSFMDAARQRLWELAEDDTQKWGVAEYDELKDWVFKQIESGKLKQTRNIICINEKKQYGNQVILRTRKSRL